MYRRFNTASGNTLHAIVKLVDHSLVVSSFNTASGNTLHAIYDYYAIASKLGVSIPQAVIPCMQFHLEVGGYISYEFQYRKR